MPLRLPNAIPSDRKAAGPSSQRSAITAHGAARPPRASAPPLRLPHRRSASLTCFTRAMASVRTARHGPARSAPPEPTITDVRALIDALALSARVRKSLRGSLFRVHRRMIARDDHAACQWPVSAARLPTAGPERGRGAAAGRVPHAVGTVPPSITYSVPVMEAARSEARNAIRLAISAGFAGRPKGMPPSASMMIRLPPA